MKLVNRKHYASEEIQRVIKQLDTTKLSLYGAWEKRNHLLTQCHDLQVSPLSFWVINQHRTGVFFLWCE